MAFYQNKVWLFFFFSLLIITLYYTAIAAYDVYIYRQLSEETFAQEVNPVIFKKSDESYLLIAEYSFTYNGNFYKGSDNTLFYPFWNEWGAEKEGKALANKKHKVFFSPHNARISALRNSFPIKSIASALILWAVQVYLFFIGRKYA